MASMSPATDTSDGGRAGGRRLAIAAIAMTAITAMAVGQATNRAAPFLLHNASPSEPEGLYVRSFEAPGVGRLVTFRTPAAGSAYVASHLTYLQRTPILKALAAGPGSRVCTTSGHLVIDGRTLAPVDVTDRSGAPLPRWRDCRRMKAGEWFAYSDRIPNSFDSRYYGPVRADQIIAVYRPLWLGGGMGR
jgi:conjugative transfer signal peptidase TraF